MAQYGDKACSANLSKKPNWDRFDMVYKARHLKIKKWMDLVHVFVEQYKFNSEIAPDRKQLQRMSKKSSESFRNMNKGGARSPPKCNQPWQKGRMSSSS